MITGCGYRAIQFFFSAAPRLLFLDGWDLLGSGIGDWGLGLWILKSAEKIPHENRVMCDMLSIEDAQVHIREAELIFFQDLVN